MPPKHDQTKEELQQQPVMNRMAFIKLGLFGIGAFVLGKFAGTLSPLSPSSSSDIKMREFKNFKVIENDKELGFYDKDGSEIMILEKE